MFLENPVYNNEQFGWIEVICGSMFSGKTEELIRRIKRAEIANQKIKVFKPVIDSRSKNFIESHDESKLECIEVKSSNEILKKIDNCDVVAIDEAQFFDDLIVPVCNKIANNGVRASQTDNNVRVKANPLNLIETFDKPEDIVAIVERLCEWLLPVQNEISEELKNDLVNSVVGNNSNIWEDEYTDFINDPDDEKEESLNKKLRSLLKEICLMPEYYLS